MASWSIVHVYDRCEWKEKVPRGEDRVRKGGFGLGAG